MASIEPWGGLLPASEAVIELKSWSFPQTGATGRAEMHRTITIRMASRKDASGILEAHYSAVHETAAKDYSAEICGEWSAPVTPERIRRYLEESFPSETAVVAEVGGVIAGFGAIVERGNELRAVYVAARFAGRGIGSALLKELERLAKERGCTELHMDSSVTAAAFYQRNGYQVLEHAEHSLKSGHRMACVRMRKSIG
ncbi:MAG: GNAT family N-acetyltransferase [Steroidobacteraceae bacterium]